MDVTVAPRSRRDSEGGGRDGNALSREARNDRADTAVAPARGERGQAPGNAEREPANSGERGGDARPSAFATVKGHPFVSAGVAIVACAAIVAGILWWLQARHYESTDDAFIDGRPVAISALVAGAIVDVPVTDNQLVAAGTVLARIDDRDYRAAQAQAQAQIEQARASIANSEAQLSTQQAHIDQTAKQVAEAQAALSFSKDENSIPRTRIRDIKTSFSRARALFSAHNKRRAIFRASRRRWTRRSPRARKRKNSSMC